MKITPQHEQFGLPDKAARSLPSRDEVADLLRGPRIQSGLMKRSDEEEA
jgi:hypothetical protein